MDQDAVLSVSAATTTSPTSIYILCEHLLFRNGLRGILRREQDVHIAGEGALTLDSSAAIEAAGAGVVILSAASPGEASGPAAQRLYRSLADVPVIVVQMNDDNEDALAALRLGARGVLDMHADATRLLSAIRAVMSGEITIAPRLATRLVADYAALAQGKPANASGPALSDREIDVMALLAHGKTNQQIADSLCVSVHTVRAHLRSIMQKLGVKNRVQAARYALNSGLGVTDVPAIFART